MSQMDRPAELMIWHANRAAPPGEARIYPTLEQALLAAADCAGDPDALPWIVTEDGEILSPHWIDQHLAGRRDRPAAGRLRSWLTHWA
ncbi:hypothetical protein M446_4948 [Methylobacterium sp. 4-46]|uniref:hypothetical protein n=1 Tax=unclassified Methylobacterium TaxID=2615210 RepID=UPI000152BFF4|nr:MULTISPECIES: hypothetical protein [Methylobacterium]ACA19277.1 hypothetical protein M446_4948 [Methylobacterium sp. 4-46]WFT78482.1 hypothetical protein QA634_24880 [Methylobacterium nodulans]